MLLGVVETEEVDEWTLRFSSGAPARIWIDAEGGTRLACVAQDAAGTLLDVDEDSTGRCHLGWVVKRTGGYRILIRNGDSVPITYRLTAR